MKTKTREGSVEVPAAPEASTRVVGVPAQSVSAAGYVLRGALFLTAFAGLVLLSRGNYLLFHAFVEGFSIVIAFGIFFIAWNSRDFLENNYLLFLGLIYPFVGFLDFLHVLSYAGMGVFAGYGADLPTQLWIQARYLESVSLLLAALFFHRRVRPHLVLSVYAGATILLLLSIFSLGIFPVCFSETGGLTTFKKVSEYVIVAVLAAALVPVVRNRANLSRTMFWFLSGSILATMVSELFFTFYVSVYGLSNMLGHLLKILSFYCVYKGLIEASLRDPYNNLFLNLKRSEEDLLRAKADL
ncbi:MAG: hypothetical protein JSV00_07795 [bacterium]|nr:MAG: hypothetical protein JSV00_07795 [bacterium]